ncbi:MAG: transporter [Pseudomonadota bacterium]
MPKSLTRYSFLCISLSLSLVLSTSSALAFQPLFTDDTGTQGAYGKQLEFSLEAERTDTGEDVVKTRGLPFVFTYGLADTLDFFVGLNYLRIHSAATESEVHGQGNPVLGAKWRFYEHEAARLSFALKPEITLPVSSQRESIGLGQGKTSYGLTAIASQEFDFGAIHANFGLAQQRYQDSESNPNSTTTHWSIAPVWNLSEQWKVAADLGVDLSKAAGVKSRSLAFELGLIYSPSKDIDLAAGLIKSMDDQNPRTVSKLLTTGVTWRFR